MADPYVGKLTYFRVYSGQLEAGSRVLNVNTGPDRADRAHPDDARQRARGGQGGLRRRHRRRGRDQAGRDRRHARRARPADQARDDRVPRAGDQGRDRAEDQGRPGEDGHGARASGRGGPDLPGAHQRGDRADRDLREWASCTSRCWSTGCCASTRSTPTSAARRSPTARRSRGTAEKVEGRFVRQTGGAGQYGIVYIERRAGARRGIRLRQQDQGRIDPDRVHPGGREGRRGGDGERPAGRLPDGRRAGHADRRQVPRHRLLRDRVQGRGLAGAEGGGRRGPSRSCSSRSSRSRSSRPRSSWAT